jgi:curved DNA-binding protein CbpA
MAVATPSPDLYGILQVDPRAELTVIQAAYHALARRVHPDLSRSDATAHAMAMLNQAYGVLRDPTQRKEYDRARLAPPAATPVTITPTADVRMPPPASAGPAKGSVLTFGRYDGWTLQQIARQDPAYLEWLRRHSSGVGYRREIDEILAARRTAGTAGSGVGRRRW